VAAAKCIVECFRASRQPDPPAHRQRGIARSRGRQTRRPTGRRQRLPVADRRWSKTSSRTPVCSSPCGIVSSTKWFVDRSTAQVQRPAATDAAHRIGRCCVGHLRRSTGRSVPDHQPLRHRRAPLRPHAGDDLLGRYRAARARSRSRARARCCSKRGIRTCCRSSRKSASRSRACSPRAPKSLRSMMFHCLTTGSSTSSKC
jgi:hypothetical protein